MKTTRKFWSILTLVIVASMMIVACGPQATEAPTSAPAVPTEPAMTEEPMTEEPAMTETAEGPVAGEIDCKGAAAGDEISMLYQWAAQEEERLNQILQPLADACGIVLRPESTRDQALLDTRVQAGTPPDVAFWNITQLIQYQDQLFEMDALGASQDAYISGATDPGVIDGKWLGLPVKSDPKTLVWYSPVNFDAFGYTVPTTWDELNALVDQIASDTNSPVPWSMGFEWADATGWIGTDFIEDILLVTQGPDYVRGIIDGSIPYNDAGVREAWEIYSNWATDPTYTIDGAQGTLSINGVEAIYKVFSDPPEAMMDRISGFAGGEIENQFPDLEYGTDYDFFLTPGAQGMQGGSDWMMAFSDKPAVQALVTYLSSPEGGKNWANAGFDLTPNKDGAGNYTDTMLANKAEAFYNAGAFVPDIGDSIPSGFGSAEFTGVTEYVNGGDLDAILDDLAARQQEALSE